MPTTNYEITYIVKANLEDADVDTRVENYAEMLRKEGATIGEIEKLGRRRLAYEIDDLREGYYVTMKFTSEAAHAKELQRQMKLDENVMRELLLNLDK